MAAQIYRHRPRRTTPQPRPQGLLVFQIRRRGSTAESRDWFVQGYQQSPEIKDEAAEKIKARHFLTFDSREGWGVQIFHLSSSPRRFGANFGARREKKTKESLPLRLWNLNSPSNREEKSLRHVAMIAKFSDDNKTKTPLKKWIRTDSKFIDLIQFHLICKILAKLSGVESERTVSELIWVEKKKKEILVLCSLACVAGGMV